MGIPSNVVEFPRRLVFSETQGSDVWKAQIRRVTEVTTMTLARVDLQGKLLGELAPGAPSGTPGVYL